MEEEKEEVKETKNNNFNKLLFVIVGIALILVGLCFGYIVGRGQSTNTNEEPDNRDQTDKPKENEEEIIKELINIADLNKTRSCDYYEPLLYKDGIINELDYDTKTMLIYKYAQRNDAITEVTCDEFDGCCGATSTCDGIKISDFNEIAKKYGITNYDFDGNRYNGMYLLGYGGCISPYESVSHDISTKKEEDGYTITDKLLFTSFDPNTVPNKEVVKEFVFKKNEDEYYLYSVKTISETEIIENENNNNLDFDFDKMKSDLNSQIKNNAKKAYIVKCTDKATDNNPFDKDEVYIELSEETIEVIINKLKTAKRYEIGTRGYLECPPHNIMYYIGGETYYNDKMFILDYDTDNTFAFGYDDEGYIFEFEDDLTGFIESLETYKK